MGFRAFSGSPLCGRGLPPGLPPLGVETKVCRRRANWLPGARGERGRDQIPETETEMRGKRQGRPRETPGAGETDRDKRWRKGEAERSQRLGD